MGYSVTLSDDSRRDAIPTWARYAVTFVDSKAWERPSTVQYFSSRTECERWARAVMRTMPRPADDMCPDTWALVYALPPVRRDRVGGALCYLAIDPGGIVVKRHAFPSDEYGQRAAPTTHYATF